MYWSVDKVLAVAVHLSCALGAVVPAANHKILKTTTTKHGQVIDWVVRESQGHIASPPLGPASKESLVTIASNLLDHELGPKGTVPILRDSGDNVLKKQPPPSAEEQSKGSDLQARADYSGRHWYASSSQGVDNHGGSAVYSLFKAYVEAIDDFSLLQVAVIRGGVPGVTGSGLQTVEAGWINYPRQVSQPHLFAYFTTDGHQSNSDNVGGWNRDVKGFVQYDSSVYPGIPFTQLSVDGGEQHDIKIAYTLYQGNWWLSVGDKFIGYYPASLFTRGGNSAPQTLETKANRIDFYGEVVNSRSQLTTTDMGSGEFAAAGQGRAGYIRNIAYEDTNGNLQNYVGRGYQDDVNRYTIKTTYGTSGSWGNYFFLGGPGAGGVIGG